MGELAVKYGFYSAEWDPKPHGTAFPMGEGTIVHYIFAALISLPVCVRVCVCTFHSLSFFFSFFLSFFFSFFLSFLLSFYLSFFLSSFLPSLLSFDTILIYALRGGGADRRGSSRGLDLPYYS